MSGEQGALGIPAFLQVWRDAAQHVLQQVAGTAFTVAEMAAAEASKGFSEVSGAGVWFRLVSSPPWKGEMALLVAPTTGVLLAQTLMAEAPDETAPLNDDRRDALNELFRQFAGQVATAIKAKTHTEMAIKLEDNQRPPMPPAVQSGSQLSSASFPPIAIFVQLGMDLAASLQKAAAPKAKETSVAVSTAPTGPAAARHSQNVDLLLDVQVEATLRFGEQTLPLRDVLELASGAVVELDRRVNDPGDLYVGGKLIARGEVVIVDGNYGLRITEIVSPYQPAASLTQ